MKKLILVASTCILLSGIAIAQQDSTMRIPKKTTDPAPTMDKNYSDSSSKYAPYGDSTKHSKKDGKKRSQRDATESLHPAGKE